MKWKILHARETGEPGFTIIEILFALLILAFGLLAAGQMIFVALSSASLARSKSNAALLAQDKIEFLADLHRREPESPLLSEGNHGPDLVQIRGSGASTLDRYSVTWEVSAVPDARKGVRPIAKGIRVTVLPVDSDGRENKRIRLNKPVIVSSIFCAGLR
jgi:prepilin-type N-terminal cleavage/methylation domain-containing protein